MNRDRTTPNIPSDKPQRTCVGCRRVDEQAKLLRAVASAAGRLRFDLPGTRRSPGRGCYVHRTASCMQAAVRGGFGRSLRRSLRLGESHSALLSEGARESAPLTDDEIRAVMATRDDS